MQLFENRIKDRQDSITQLTQNPPLQTELVKTFIDKLGPRPAEVREHDLHLKATKFLTESNTSIRDLLGMTEAYRVVISELLPLKQMAEMTRKNTGSLTAKEIEQYRSEIHKGLEPLRKACSLQRHYRPDEIPSLRMLQSDLHQLDTIATRELSTIQERVNRHITAFKELVRQSVREISSQAVTLRKAEELKTVSTYYPRGISPEADACARGLLTSPGDPQHLTSLLDQYSMAEKGRGSSFEEGSFFHQLQERKNQLKTAPKSLTVIQDLRELYTQSGSEALAYFANLDCIVAGDRSHDTLFRAFRLATSLDLLKEFKQVLENVAKDSASEPILFHLSQVLARLGYEAEASDLAKKWPLDSVETHMLKHIKAHEENKKFGKKDYLPNIRRAWKEDSSHTTIYIEAALLEEEPYREKSLTLVECAPNDARVVKRLLDPMLRGIPNWSNIEQTIHSLKVSCPKAWIAAGEKALELSDTERARTYFLKAKDVCATTNPNNRMDLTASLVSLAKTYETTDKNMMQALIAQARLYSPHHPRVTCGGRETHPKEPRIESAPSELVMPKSASVPSPSWSDEIREELKAALSKSTDFEEGLLDQSSTYKTAKFLLSPTGELMSQLEQASGQLKKQIELVDLTIKKAPCKVAVWESHCGLIHWQLSLSPARESFGFFANSLKLLTDTLADLDPDGDYFSSLQNYGRLEALAGKAQSTWFECSRSAAAAGKVELRPLSEFKSCLEGISALLDDEINPSIKGGEALLATWARDMYHLHGGASLVLNDLFNSAEFR